MHTSGDSDATTLKSMLPLMTMMSMRRNRYVSPFPLLGGGMMMNPLLLQNFQAGMAWPYMQPFGGAFAAHPANGFFAAPAYGHGYGYALPALGASPAMASYYGPSLFGGAAYGSPYAAGNPYVSGGMHTLRDTHTKKRK